MAWQRGLNPEETTRLPLATPATAWPLGTSLRSNFEGRLASPAVDLTLGAPLLLWTIFRFATTCYTESLLHLDRNGVTLELLLLCAAEMSTPRGRHRETIAPYLTNWMMETSQNFGLTIRYLQSFIANLGPSLTKWRNTNAGTQMLRRLSKIAIQTPPVFRSLGTLEDYPHPMIIDHKVGDGNCCDAALNASVRMSMPRTMQQDGDMYPLSRLVGSDGYNTMTVVSSVRRLPLSLRWIMYANQDTLVV